MEQSANVTSLSSLKSRPNKVATKYQFDKEGSHATASTAPVDETSSLHSDAKRSPVPKKLVMTISTPSRIKSTVNASNNSGSDGSFKFDDDSNWWHSPKVPTDESLFSDESVNPSEFVDGPKSNDTTDDEAPTKPEEKILDKKKKVKRISMIKMKASDMVGLSTHQFQQTGNFEADQKELHKIVMKLKADKNARERSTKPEGSSIAMTSKPRSQSKMRTRNLDEGESNNVVHHQRSKSTGRRGSDAEIVDLTPETRSKSVTRRSRSVARKEETEDSNSAHKSDDVRKSSTRGRSIGSKRVSGTSGKEVAERSTTSNGKPRERSRSVARQRMGDIDNYDDDGDDEATNQLRRRSHNIIDLATGLALVDRDTRSRSVARKRPGEEEAATRDVEDVHSFLASQKSVSSRSKSSVRSGESEKEKSRSKSVGRKVRNNEDTSSHQSSSRGGSVIKIVDKEKRRSKSVGRTVKTVDDNGLPNKVEVNNSKSSSDFLDRANISTGKSIPWTEFLKHAQSG